MKDADIIIIEERIDTASTLCEAAKILKNQGANRIFAFATHGIFSGPGVQRIEESVLEQVFVTDTIPLPVNE